MLEKLGPYKFISVLGRGGMGTVFKGEHEETGELHAVKVLAPAYSQEPHFRARFESEIKALLKLDHTNIVRLLSFGQESGNMFFAMEMVDGKSLFEVQKSGHKFTPPQCMSIAKDVCLGLKHAHDRGIIHRDLKPGNLMLTKDLVVKITDFGIAKSYGSSQNTGTNILGTMDFMSPEQAKGEPVTAKSDIYSLGTVLFTLLSGKPPFTANSIEESFRNLTRIPAPYVSSVVPDVPHEVDHLIRRMMEKKPEKRLATAQATLHKINEAERMLRDYSEAKTVHQVPFDSDGKQKTSISGLGESSSCELPNKKLPKNKTSDKAKVKSQEKILQPKTAVGGKTRSRIKNTDKTQLNDPEQTSYNMPYVTPPESLADDDIEFEIADEIEPPTVELDYFNTVTDEEREVSATEPELHQSQGVWGLLLGLIAVIALGVVGAWWTTRSPSADELYSQVVQFREEPHRAVEASAQFISLYPDDERLSEVVGIHKVGSSIDFYHDLVNKLSVRARIPGESRMTEIEDQFHDIVRLADDDMKAADAKMAAFIIVHDGNELLAQRDQDCVEAAKGFRLKTSANDPIRIEQRVKKIHAAMQRAEQMESVADATEVYLSLIHLHEDENWADQETLRLELLATIEQRIDDLNDE